MIPSACGKKYFSSSNAGVIQLREATTTGGASLVERHFGDLTGNLAGEGAALAGVAHDDDASGLFDALDDLLVVEGHKGAGVDDLRGHAVLLLEDVGGLYRPVQHRADGEDGHVLADALDVGIADLDLILPFGHAALVEELADIVDTLALQEDDGVRAVQGGLHEALGVVRGGREDHLQAGDMGAAPITFPAASS